MEESSPIYKMYRYALCKGNPTPKVAGYKFLVSNQRIQANLCSPMKVHESKNSCQPTVLTVDGETRNPGFTHQLRFGSLSHYLIEF